MTQLPLVRCQICGRTIAHQPGRANEVLTEHYVKAHPEMLGSGPPVAEPDDSQ